MARDTHTAVNRRDNVAEAPLAHRRNLEKLPRMCWRGEENEMGMIDWLSKKKRFSAQTTQNSSIDCRYDHGYGTFMAIKKWVSILRALRGKAVLGGDQAEEDAANHRGGFTSIGRNHDTRK